MPTLFTPFAAPGTASAHLARFLRSASFRLTAFYAGVFGVSAALLFAVIYLIATDAMNQQAASAAEQDMAELVDIYATGGQDALVREIETRIADTDRPYLAYLLVDHNGRALAGNLPINYSHANGGKLSSSRQNGEDAGEPSEEENEHEAILLRGSLAGGDTLAVGYDRYRITEAQEAILHAFGWAMVLTGLLALSGGAVVSFGFLKRIDEINRTTRAVVRGALDERVALRGSGDELDELATGLNRMLDRIGALLQGLNQVSNDIAHDLRTPLSRLRQRLEAVRARDASIEDYRTAIDRAIADTDVILATFGALLRIAQIEAGARHADFDRIDLSHLCGQVVEAYVAVAEDAGQTIAAKVQPDIAIRGDGNLLTQMLANLVENAICHTPAATAVSLSLATIVGGTQLMVADTGPGIPEAERDKVFRRFYRLERSRTTPGSGLGLTLVRAVADLHGATVTLADNAPGLRITVVFPAWPPFAAERQLLLHRKAD